MSSTEGTDVAVETAPADEVVATRTPAAGRRLATRWGLVRYSGAYGIVVLIVLYGLLLPSTFLTTTTLRTTLGDQSVVGILALGSLVPLAAGLIDLSFAAVAGFGLVFVSWLSLHLHVADSVLILLTLAACVCFGLISSLLVAHLGVGSFVATLGVSTVALGVSQKLGGNGTLTPRFGRDLEWLGGGTLLGLPMTFVILVVLAAATYVWLEHTPSGRYVLAAGDNPAAATLAGVRVRRLQASTLIWSSAVAGLAGILLASKIGFASTVTTNGYLLPVVAGLFLGASQVKPRVNVLGTLIAIYLIGIGIKGLQLAGVDVWVNAVFNGLVLLLAVSLTAIRARRST